MVFMNFLSNIENRIVNMLTLEHYNNLEREKIKFGVRLILNDIWKIIIIYLIAILLDCFFITFFTHIVFFILRQVCLGFHFQNNIVCLLMSILAFPIGVIIIKDFHLSIEWLILFTGTMSLLLFIFSPIGTSKRPVFNYKHRQYLKKKIAFRLFVLWLCFIFIPSSRIFIFYGITLQLISVLTQKFVGGKENV